MSFDHTAGPGSEAETCRTGSNSRPGVAPNSDRTRRRDRPGAPGTPTSALRRRARGIRGLRGPEVTGRPAVGRNGFRPVPSRRTSWWGGFALVVAALVALLWGAAGQET